jgi:hypothetical protein
MAWKSGSSDPWKPPVLCAHCMASLTSLSSILHCALHNPSLACHTIWRSTRLARGDNTGKRSTLRSGVPPLQAAAAGGATPRCAQTRPGPDQAALLCRAQRAFLNALRADGKPANFGCNCINKQKKAISSRYRGYRRYSTEISPET